MKKPRSLSELNDLLTDELAWRVKEIADLKLALKTSAPVMAKSLARAAVPILYAHWEGYIKTTATGYLEYLNNLGLALAQFEDCFIALGARRRLMDLANSKDFVKHVGVVRFFLRELNRRSPLKFPGAISTRANLNSEVFEEIALSIGLNASGYRARYNLIDQSLLGNRNGIAHGDWLRLETDECRTLADDVIQLLRDFNSDIYNLASTRAYLR